MCVRACAAPCHALQHPMQAVAPRLVPALRLHAATLAHVQAGMHTHTHAGTLAHMHACRHARTHAGVHMSTCTHTCAPCGPPPPLWCRPAKGSLGCNDGSVHDPQCRRPADRSARLHTGHMDTLQVRRQACMCRRLTLDRRVRPWHHIVGTARGGAHRRRPRDALPVGHTLGSGLGLVLRCLRDTPHTGQGRGLWRDPAH